MQIDYSVPNSQHRNSSRRKAQTISKKVKTASDALHKLSYTVFKQITEHSQQTKAVRSMENFRPQW